MDIKSINTNVNRLLSNIWAIITFLKEFTVDDAKDVSITFLNENGTESIKTFPNIEKQLVALESWKQNLDKSFDVSKAFEKKTIPPGESATFLIPSMRDATLVSLLVDVNVSGDNNIVHSVEIDLHIYNAGGNNYQPLKEGLSVNGRDWRDSYIDGNVLMINKYISYGAGTLKIDNKDSSRTLEIFAITAKIKK